ncbi:hypothetical protein BH23THE1_BH23THE1_06400 [soil metagenome]
MNLNIYNIQKRPSRRKEILLKFIIKTRIYFFITVKNRPQPNNLIRDDWSLGLNFAGIGSCDKKLSIL